MESSDMEFGYEATETGFDSQGFENPDSDLFELAPVEEMSDDTEPDQPWSATRQAVDDAKDHLAERDARSSDHDSRDGTAESSNDTAELFKNWKDAIEAKMATDSPEELEIDRAKVLEQLNLMRKTRHESLSMWTSQTRPS